MRLTPDDILCCPPPLFHCFGLVLGLMAVITHGAKIVYPAEVFDAPATLRAVISEQCTALHGVPAMFDSLLALPEAKDLRASDLRLRTGIIAGAPVPRYLMEQLVAKLGMTEFTSSYGLTEASPTCFNAFTDDPIHTRLTTVGTLMPHALAKIVDRDGNIVPVGTRGELCIGGYQLQAGYWNNSEKTNEVMVRDEAGVLWLHTGDEAVFDERGYCSITGRFKDIIIRGESSGPEPPPSFRSTIRMRADRHHTKAAKTSTPSRSKSAWSPTPPSPRRSWSASRTRTTARWSAPFSSSTAAAPAVPTKPKQKPKTSSSSSSSSINNTRRPPRPSCPATTRCATGSGASSASTRRPPTSSGSAATACPPTCP